MNMPDPNAFSLDINDPEDAELIEYFLGELPNRIEAIEAACSGQDHEQLERLAHQLKGSAPGFGFPAIGSAAGELEKNLRELDRDMRGFESVQSEVDGLIALCQSYISPSS